MKNDNKGYSLVELIICIAIMTILAVISFVSLGILNRAKARDAANTIDTQLHSLWVNTNSKSSDSCLKLEYVDDSYVLIHGTYEGGTFTPEKDSNGNEVCNVLNNRVVVEYVPVGSTSGTGNAYIQFSKSDGSVKSGAGTYNIYLKNGSKGDAEDYSGNLIKTVVLKAATGNHNIE